MKPVDLPPIPLPSGWNQSVKRAVLAAFSLAHFTLIALRAWGNGARVPHVQRELSIERLETEVALLREQLRIVLARYAKIPPLQRPHYDSGERFSILAVREARGWSIARTAGEFHIAAQTVASWLGLLENDALVAPPGPVNRYPELVTAVVQGLKRLFPLLGARQIAAWLARAGCHLAVTTVRRMIARPPTRQPRPFEKAERAAAFDAKPARTVTSRFPCHVWHADITTVPTSAGLALCWLPFAFPALFPFCYKVAVVLDHFSRRALAIRAFHKEPSADQIVDLLDAAVARCGKAPRHIVTDKGAQFFDRENEEPASAFAAWLDAHGVKPRFGAVGKKGSIAIIERFIRTLKYEGTRRMLVPYRIDHMQAELELLACWYNTERPHSALCGCTPDEAFRGQIAPRDRPRIEPRARYPIAAGDVSSGKVKRVAQLALDAGVFQNRPHLPVVALRFAA